MPIARRAGYSAALIAALAFFAVAVIAAMPGARAWAKGAPGGLSSTTPEYQTEPTAPESETTTGETAGTALLLGTGRAAAPLNAPPAVKKVIAAANRIRTKPYIWGGGHGRWWDRGYDCSGSVSFALHGGGFLSMPLTSGSLESWGQPGKGRWITIYANSGHVFAVIAGLRWDTVGDTSGTGPRWHPEMVSSRGYVARHPAGY